MEFSESRSGRYHCISAKCWHAFHIVLTNDYTQTSQPHSNSKKCVVSQTARIQRSTSSYMGSNITSCASSNLCVLRCVLSLSISNMQPPAKVLSSKHRIHVYCSVNARQYSAIQTPRNDCNCSMLNAVEPTAPAPAFFYDQKGVKYRQV